MPVLPEEPKLDSARVTGERRKPEISPHFKLDEDEELAKLLRPDSVQAHADAELDLEDHEALHMKEDMEIEKLLKNDQVKDHPWGEPKQNIDSFLGKQHFCK